MTDEYEPTIGDLITKLAATGNARAAQFAKQIEMNWADFEAAATADPQWHRCADDPDHWQCVTGARYGTPDKLVEAFRRKRDGANYDPGPIPDLGVCIEIPTPKGAA